MPAAARGGLRGSEQACERRVARVARADADADHPGTRADADAALAELQTSHD